MKFLGNVLSTVIGLFVFLMLSFFGIVFIATLFSDDSGVVEVESGSVIELNLENIKNDYAGKYKDPFVSILEEGKSCGLTDVLNAIENAKTDDDIKGISILNNLSELGMAQTKALRDALEDFKKSKKFVLSYSNLTTQKDYYLNSVANEVYVNPMGAFDFKGLSAELMFFKDLQEKSGVKLEVIRHGKYKSAVEPFLENEMSPANKEQTLSLLQSVWNSILTDISKNRNITITKLNEIAEGLLARTPQMAKAQNLVDFVGFEDEYHDAIRKKLNINKEDDYPIISIQDYTQYVSTTANLDLADDKIAVIYAQGNIMSGEGDINTIGEISINRSLIEARKDENIKAIVLRIDSPGGDALTSDIIWREIELTKKVKPVVVSMGNYAASGGYYIACNANKIYAEKSTITGSIGVFGVLPNFTQLATKIGIHTQQVNTNANAAEYSPFVPINEKFKAVTLESVEYIYKTFVSHVAKGRKMSFAQVDAIAQGRVWSGQQALKIGLVDKIGGLDEAIKEAARFAKIKSFSTQNFPEFDKNFDDVLNDFSSVKLKELFLKEELGNEAFLLLQRLKKNQTYHGIQAAMPFEINIK